MHCKYMLYVIGGKYDGAGVNGRKNLNKWFLVFFEKLRK